MVFKLFLIIAVFVTALPIGLARSEPTLLEAWVWLSHKGLIEIDEIQETEPGKFILQPNNFSAVFGNDAIYKVVDKDACVIRQEVPALRSSIEYYLNNFLPEATRIDQDGGRIGSVIFSEKVTHCVIQEKTECFSSMIISANDIWTYQRSQRALEYIFSNFCRYADHSRPF